MLAAGFEATYRLKKATAGACAEICYYTGCSRAHFDPRGSLCLLGYAQSASAVRAECNAVEGGFVKEYSGPAAFLTCVICGAPIDAAIAATAATPRPRPQPRPQPRPANPALPVIRQATDEDLAFAFGLAHNLPRSPIIRRIILQNDPSELAAAPVPLPARRSAPAHPQQPPNGDGQGAFLAFSLLPPRPSLEQSTRADTTRTTTTTPTTPSPTTPSSTRAPRTDDEPSAGLLSYQ